MIPNQSRGTDRHRRMQGQQSYAAALIPVLDGQAFQEVNKHAHSCHQDEQDVLNSQTDVRLFDRQHYENHKGLKI